MPDMSDDFKEKMRELQIFWIIQANFIGIVTNTPTTIVTQSTVPTD